MNALIRQAVAPSTRRVYASGVRCFERFCTSHGLHSLPASEHTIRLFCTKESARVTAATISTYVAAIRMNHLTCGFADPTADAPLLSLLLTGIKRTSKATRQPRQPVTISTLKLIKHSLNTLYPAHDRHMLWAACTLAFYGFLRASEYTAPTKRRSSRFTLTARQVVLTEDSITVRLRRSKTCQFKMPPPIHIGATNDSTCPVSAMACYLAERRAPHSSPLFLFRDDSFLTVRQVSSTLRQTLQAAGLDPTGFSSHSFRVGAATTASAAGLPDHTIQQLGRWKSQAFKGYIRPLKQTLQKTTRTLAMQS